LACNELLHQGRAGVAVLAPVLLVAALRRQRIAVAAEAGSAAAGEQAAQRPLQQVAEDELGQVRRDPLSWLLRSRCRPSVTSQLKPCN